MGSWLKDRHNQIKLFFFALMILLAGRLFYMTVIQGQIWGERAEKSEYQNGIHICAERRDTGPIRQTAGRK